MAERLDRGLLDASVVMDLNTIDDDCLPKQVAISAFTLAELAAGPHTTSGLDERRRRQDRLQRTESTFDPFPFDDGAARAYGRIYAAVAATKARGPRAVDLLIAATALAADIHLFTRNAADLAGVTDLLEVIPV